MWRYNCLQHHGIPGQKWGVRRFQNEDGTLTPLGRERYGVGGLRAQSSVFVSGSSKTQDPDSGYYRKHLPKPISDKLDEYMRDKKVILVGDAPGIDRQVQDYLNDKQYQNVRVYGPGTGNPRYLANSKWKTKMVDAPGFQEGSKEWLAAKDVKMTEDADEGLAVILDEGAKATRKNVERLLNSGKAASVFQLGLSSPDLDKWVDGASIVVTSIANKKTASAVLTTMKNFKYKEFDKLMSPAQVEKTKSGSCHDQVMYEINMLKKAGIEASAKFVIALDNRGKGGDTHSFVYYKNPDGSVVWIENAWASQRGVNMFNNEKEMMQYVADHFNKKNGEKVYISDFNADKHYIGEDLQTLVNIATAGDMEEY